MKRLFFIFSLFLMSAAGFGQGWEKIYGGIDFDVARSVRQLFDGGYVFAGEGRSFGTGIVMGKTDALGDTLWTKSFGEPSWIAWDHAASIIQTNDSGYAMAGHYWSYGADVNFGDIFLIKLDAAGNQQWIQMYANPNAIDEGKVVLQTSDGGYILANLGSYTPTVQLDYPLIKTDLLGNTQWAVTYSGKGIVVAQGVQETYDGGFVMSGYIDTPDDTNGVYGDTTGLFTLKTDINGNTEWVSIFPDFISPYGDHVNAVFQTSDSNYVFTGAIEDSVVLSKTYLMKLDANGDTLWTKIFDLQGGAFGNYSEYVVETNDGGLALTGTSFDSLDIARLYLMKTDASGNMQWIKYYQDESSGKELHQTTDNGFIICGGKYTTSAELYLIKTDSMGNLETNIANIQNQTKPFTIYPNPTTGTFTVQGAKGEIEVYDLFGRLVLRSNKREIDMGNYPSGIYMVRVGEALRKIVVQ